MTMSLTTNEVRNIIDYISEEVRRQRRGPLQVASMTQAWMDAIERSEQERHMETWLVDNSNPPTLDDIRMMGMVLEPEFNPPDQHGDPRWRGHHIHVGGSEGVSPHSLDYAMDEWYQNMPGLTPAENYYKFELIHPFGDGNGRAGKIIFNWLSGTLRRPEWPPDFFGGIENP